MHVKFWGVRGSIPTPGPDTLKYGGNTPCIEVLTQDNERIILDAGTGIRVLSLELAKNMPVSCSIFISHTHWDHIQGLPFFIPLFVPGNEMAVYGTPDPVSMKSIRDALSDQMVYRYFPVREAELKAAISYQTLKENQTVRVGSASVTTILMNHPVLNFGFKIQENGKSLFYSGDHEPYYNIYGDENKDFKKYEKHILDRRENIVDFIKGVDVLVVDSQYTEEEYQAKKGWGHSTFRSSVELALEAGIPKVILTHHEPTRSDDQLDAVLAGLHREYADRPIEIDLAREGLELDI